MLVIMFLTNSRKLGESLLKSALTGNENIKIATKWLTNGYDVVFWGRELLEDTANSNVTLTLANSVIGTLPKFSGYLMQVNMGWHKSQQGEWIGRERELSRLGKRFKKNPRRLRAAGGSGGGKASSI